MDITKKIRVSLESLNIINQYVSRFECSILHLYSSHLFYLYFQMYFQCISSIFPSLSKPRTRDVKSIYFCQIKNQFILPTLLPRYIMTRIITENPNYLNWTISKNNSRSLELPRSLVPPVLPAFTATERNAAPKVTLKIAAHHRMDHHAGHLQDRIQDHPQVCLLTIWPNRGTQWCLSLDPLDSWVEIWREAEGLLE